MSIIQDIRDKYARLTVVLIALALIGFILTDYFSGKLRGLGQGNTSVIGKVNGQSINFEDFNVKVGQMEANMKQQGYPQSGGLTQQAIEQTWLTEINRILVTGEFTKLGIRVGKKELGDILYGTNPPADLKKQFSDEKTGQYNAVLAKQSIDQMLKKGTAEQKENISNYISQLIMQRQTDKFTSLLSNSVNYARWFVEKQNADMSQMAKVSMVKEVYTSIPDSTIKIEEKEIADYISKHKNEFKQEEGRNINYVSFSAQPSAADSNEVKNNLLKLKDAFDSTDNIQQFLLSEGVSNYYDGYISGKTIQIAVKDSIFKIPVGSIYGPYIDGSNFVLAKLEGIKQMPDTVKVRHILISTQQRDSATAYKLTDSIKNAIARGASFDSLCAKYSDDPGSKDKGGVYENVPSGQMTPPFNDYIFLNPAGSKGIVKTDFGYHYVEILSQKGGGPAYKIAYLSKEILTSQETDNKALEDANQFAGDSRDLKSFDANFEKTLKPKGLVKGIATEIKPSDAQIQGIGVSRALVRIIYDAKQGEVLKPERAGDAYIVAVVTEILKEGTQSVAKARPMVEPILRNGKKAEKLKQKIGKVSTLEAAATALAKPIETVDSVRMNGSQSNAIGYEPRVIGAAFNTANKGKIVPEALEGVSGVYVIRVDSVRATSLTMGSVADQRKNQSLQMRQYVNNPQSPAYPINALKNAATIKDYRSRRY